MVRSLVWSIALATASCCAAANETSGTVTILEGEARLYRGIERLTAVEGLRLAAGDILETADSAFAQIEFSNRFVIQFGPATRALIHVARSRGKNERVVYVLNGWGKVTNSQTGPADEATFDIRVPQIEVPAAPGVVVFNSTATDATIFAERGDVQLSERSVKGAPLKIALKTGQYYQKTPAVSGGVLNAAPRTFVEQLPRHFRDSLPLRIDKFRGREVKLKEAPPFTYADVEPWLKAEPTIRRQFVQRWRAKSREPAFRTALIANLSSHPEWDPILFPEKYLPKDPPPSRDTGVSPTPGPANQPPARQ